MDTLATLPEPEPGAHLEHITPERAQELLASNTHNRPIRPARINSYADEMGAGLWKLTGETIKIAADGTIIDGQHRLLACLQAGEAFDAYVVTGLDRQVFAVIDNPLPRHAKDAIQVSALDRGVEEKSVALLAATLRLVGRYQEHGTFIRGAAESARACSRPNNTKTGSAALETLERNPEIREYVARTVDYQSRIRGVLAPSMFAGCWYLFSRQDPEAADLFMDKLATGLNAEADDPVYVLRERLMKSQAAAPRTSARIPDAYTKLALIFKAWRYTRQGRKCKYLHFSRTDSFPSLDDLPLPGETVRPRPDIERRLVNPPESFGEEEG